MIQSISEYSQGLAFPNYKETNFDPTLDLTILAKKRQEYEKVAATIDNLQQKALSIDLLNKDGIGKLSAYNQEIQQTLNGDLGDLTDSNVQAKISGLFSKIAGDVSLVGVAKGTRAIRQEMALIEKAKMTKDGAVAYNAQNEAVFYGYEGGVNDFMNASAEEAASMTTPKYVPYKDITQKYLNLKKEAKAFEDSEVRQKSLGNGYMEYKSYKGLSETKARAMVLGTWNADDEAQLEVQSKYTLMKMKAAGQLDQIATQYDLHAKKSLSDANAKIKNSDDLITMYETYKKAGELSPEREKEINDKITDAMKLKEYYTSKRDDYVDTLAKEKEGLSQARSLNEYLPFVHEMHRSDKLDALTNGLVNSETVEKTIDDEAYHKLQGAALAKERLNLDRSTTNAELALKSRQVAVSEGHLKIAQDNQKAEAALDSAGTPIAYSEGEIKRSSTQELDIQMKEQEGVVADLVTGNFRAKELWGSDAMTSAITYEQLEKAIQANPGNYELQVAAAYMAANKNQPTTREALSAYINEVNKEGNSQFTAEKNARNRALTTYNHLKGAKEEVMKQMFDETKAIEIVNALNPFIEIDGKEVPITKSNLHYMRDQGGKIMVKNSAGKAISMVDLYTAPAVSQYNALNTSGVAGTTQVVGSVDYHAQQRTIASKIGSYFRKEGREVDKILADKNITASKSNGILYVPAKGEADIKAIRKEVPNIVKELINTDQSFTFGAENTFKYIQSVTVPTNDGKSKLGKVVILLSGLITPTLPLPKSILVHPAGKLGVP